MRRLSQIAADVRRFWPTVHFAARPYLEAMAQLDTIDQMFMADSARSIVIYFLSNARGWRGPDAIRLKGELRAMLQTRGQS